MHLGDFGDRTELDANRGTPGLAKDGQPHAVGHARTPPGRMGELTDESFGQQTTRFGLEAVGRVVGDLDTGRIDDLDRQADVGVEPVGNRGER